MTIDSSFIPNHDISPDIMERNIDLVRAHLLRKMKASLSIGSDLIDKEMNGLSFLLKPIVKAFYATMVKKDLERGTKKSINGILKLSRNILEDNVDPESEDFDRLMEAKFPAYLKNDQTGRQCKKKHKNFPELAKNLKTTFEWQIRPMLKLLSIAEPNIGDYPTLCRTAFTREECHYSLIQQTDAMRYGLKVIQKDLSILDIPTARSLIFGVLTRGFKQKIADFQSEIDEIYN